MSHEPLDPHTMVALMAQVVGVNHDHIDGDTKISASDMVGRMLDEEEGIERTLPILDALAGICVSKTQHQVVAVALQLKLEEGRICLTFAENGEVKKSLPEYIAHVWKLLQQLGAEYRQWKNYRGRSPRIPDGVGRDCRISLFTRIYNYTKYKNRSRVAKWLSGLVNFIDQLEKLRGGNLTGAEGELMTAFKALKCAYMIYDRRTGIGYKDTTHWEHLYTLLEGATQRIRVLTKDNNPFCENIATLIEPDRTKTFHLRHALRKVTSQQRHIQILIAFAHSPRLQDTLQCELTVISVPPPPERIVKLPETVDEWRNIIDQLAGDYHKVGATWPKVEASELHERFSPPEPPKPSIPPPPQLESKPKPPRKLRSISHLRFEAKSYRKSPPQPRPKNQSKPRPESDPPINVHCECALVQYLMEKAHPTRDMGLVKGPENKESEGWQEVRRQKGQKAMIKSAVRRVVKGKGGEASTGGDSYRDTWGRVPAFSYIGVSKLSCTPCQLWMRGYNSLPGPSFYTRGTHGKWYWPWGMPDLQEKYLSAKISGKISEAYLKCCRSKLRLRNLSDGSNAEMSGEQVSMDPENEKLLEEVLELAGL